MPIGINLRRLSVTGKSRQQVSSQKDAWIFISANCHRFSSNVFIDDFVVFNIEH
tara:strand:+ start:44459 stop:44620 length:162 start_codon:yes stop_codon:yes gene_type:complete